MNISNKNNPVDVRNKAIFSCRSSKCCTFIDTLHFLV